MLSCSVNGICANLLNSYQKYYNEARTHLSLHKDAPIPRAVQTVGRTLAMPVLGGRTTNTSERRFPTGTGASACDDRVRAAGWSRRL